MKKKSASDARNVKFESEKLRLLKAINSLYEEANSLSRRKNEEEEALQDLCEKKDALIREVLKKGKSFHPASLADVLADPKKLQKHLAKLGDRKTLREIEQAEREIARKKTNLEKYELVKRALEKEVSQELEKLYKELNELNQRHFSAMMKEKDEAYHLVKSRLAELEDELRELQEEILECRLALKFEEKPKELFKWW